jgi:DNA-binding CsgD family transcriptional regulator
MPHALSTNESRRVMRLAAQLSQPMPAGSVLAQPGIAEDMLRLFDADFIGSTRWNPETESFEGAHCVGRGAEMAEQYLRHFQFIDPISPVLRRRRRASHIDAGMRREELHRTAYFNEFLRPFRTVEGVDLYLYRGDRNVGDLRVWRGAGRKPMGERETTLLDLLRPYLLNAMITPRSAATMPLDALMRSLEPHRWPCFVFERAALAGRATPQGNPAADALWRSLPAPQAESLRQQLARVAATGCPAHWETFTLCVVCPEPGGGALIQLVPMDPPGGTPATLVERFGLTPREAQICELLVKGMTDREIGRLLRIGYWTVRTHLQHVFRKVEVSNRVELTHRLVARTEG